jgi:hypothetical protein
MQKVESHDHYHEAFNLNQLEANLAAKKAQLNITNQETNIVQASKEEKSNQEYSEKSGSQ